MFRELSRKNQKLTHDECIRILKEEKRGVLSVTGDNGYPYGMPMNHFYGDDGCIWFHCGKKGHRLDAIDKDNRVSFCVFDSGYIADGDWEFTVRSVIVFGKIEVVQDMNIIGDITRKLSLKFIQDEEHIRKEIENSAKNTLLLKLVPEHICGKTVKES